MIRRLQSPTLSRKPACSRAVRYPCRVAAFLVRWSSTPWRRQGFFVDARIRFMGTALPLSVRARQTGDQPISYFMKEAVENPNLISLAAGLVDADSLPAGEIAEVAADILRRPQTAQAALQYGTTQGYAPLRERLLARTAALDGTTPAALSLSRHDVVITTGSQQLLYLVGEMLFDPGDIVITAAPSYFVYQGTLNSLSARTLSVPVDDEGMDT